MVVIYINGMPSQEPMFGRMQHVRVTQPGFSRDILLLPGYLRDISVTSFFFWIIVQIFF